MSPRLAGGTTLVRRGYGVVPNLPAPPGDSRALASGQRACAAMATSRGCDHAGDKSAAPMPTPGPRLGFAPPPGLGWVPRPPRGRGRGHACEPSGRGEPPQRRQDCARPRRGTRSCLAAISTPRGAARTPARRDWSRARAPLRAVPAPCRGWAGCAQAAAAAPPPTRAVPRAAGTGAESAAAHEWGPRRGRDDRDRAVVPCAAVEDRACAPRGAAARAIRAVG